MARWSTVGPVVDRRFVQDLSGVDREVLGVLYDVYAERLLDYLTSTGCDPKAVTDVLHDTFIDAYRRAPRMRDRTQLRPWLYGAARRRCIQRGRTPGLTWYWAAAEPDAQQVESATGLTAEQCHRLVEDTLGRLDPADQETLFLALRHDLSAADLSVVLGLPARRVAQRIGRAREQGGALLDAEISALNQACTEPEQAGCAACARRRQLTVELLLDLPPVSVLPVAVRHRVIHTATDPELAGHRTDIAARGGALTSEGLPRQPDVPSQGARRWMVLTGAALGTVATAMVAALVLGSGVADVVWPFTPRPDPDLSHTGPQAADRNNGQPQPPGAQPRRTGPSRPQPSVAQPAGPRTPPSPGATIEPPQPPTAPETPETNAPSAAPIGVLEVGPATLTLNGDNRGVIVLTARRAEVQWRAVISTADLSLSALSGSIRAGASVQLTVELGSTLLTLPGEATVTFADQRGNEATVRVVWELGLL